MAHFRGTVHGSRGSESRLGGKKSGIHTRADGWHCGVAVDGWHDEKDGDEYRIFATTGSGGRGTETQIGTVRLIDGKPTFTPVGT